MFDLIANVCTNVPTSCGHLSISAMGAVNLVMARAREKRDFKFSAHRYSLVMPVDVFRGLSFLEQRKAGESFKSCIFSIHGSPKTLALTLGLT